MSSYTILFERVDESTDDSDAGHPESLHYHS